MRLEIGYVPLMDAAALIVAVELGFAAGEGLQIDLVREPSWATLRDRLALGHLDGAHMLGPLAIASALGLSGVPTALTVPIALNLNGNAITVSLPLWEEMAPKDDDIGSIAKAFAAAAERRAAAGRPLTLGTVHPFSSHTYQLRRFAERGGLDIDRRTRLIVIPPPQIAETLRRDLIDGFCVGSPWNSLAVEAGYGRIVALGSEVIRDCPEKVLALPTGDDAACLPLVRALRRAGQWCADAGNAAELAALLARRSYLDVDAILIRRALQGRIIVGPDGAGRSDERFVVFDAAAQRPRREHVDWFLEEMRRAGQLDLTPAMMAAADRIYRPDLFDVAST
ncbi:CmpA/NrtA family ABC transporter substrate-binding protein [Methylobacterium iners]|uniref:Nitrate/nitrite binding protein NrtA n=1 Tax=Methylobacterium iners TaxID=418707 RepID=A0ABQ4RU44_9HYPH|nr:CmpA/NrtA family ABC transporter substrate-binding protein [Methylobacterium iners]GJD94321.1 Nitrate/nitrite binding protein NrtA [Methylobacterium iners]